MAIVQQASAKSAEPAAYESAVERQIAAARRRLRGFDVATWGLGFTLLVVGYGLVMALADMAWRLPQGIRLAAWLLFVATSTCLGAMALSRLLFRRISSRFLARQLEQTVPEAKNSVINWLDLRDQPLTPVIRGSLGRRAAKDVGRSDAEKAIKGHGMWWFAGVAAVLLLIQFGWLVSSPGQVWSLLQRAFFPFDSSPIALRTTLTLLEPKDGDIAVPVNRNVKFRVQADGYVPGVNQADSLKLHFRYQQSEPYEVRPLQSDLDGVWTTTVHADQVRNGFWYKITGGDARLPEDREYRVEVLTAPQVLRFEAAFKYRPYLQAMDRTVIFERNSRPNIKEMRGTDVTLLIRTNRDLKHCVLEFSSAGSKTTLPGEPVLGDPEAWRFKWVLDKSGEFRILFMSKEGEENVDRQACTIEVIDDLSPEVLLTLPGNDVTLPANGTLYVEGYAKDDFGVKAMQLCLKPIQSEATVELKPKIYRPDVVFQLPNGKYPLHLDYSDFLALEDLRTTAGEPFPLAAGMVLEYWLEALDNCDYPRAFGNIGRSTKYKLTIAAPEPNKDKAANDRNQAQKQAEQNQRKQDGKLDAQKMQAEAEKKSAQTSAGDQGQGGQSQKNLDEEAKKVNDALQDTSNPGSARGDDNINKSEAKEKGPQVNKGGAGKDSPPDQKDGGAQDKQQGDQGKGDEPGKAKDAGKDQGGAQKSQPKDSAASGKDAGNPDAGKQPPGEKKGGDNKGGADTGAKSETKPGDKGDPSTAKGGDGKGDKGADKGSDKGPGQPGAEITGKGDGLGQTKGATTTDQAAAKNAPLTKEPMSGAKGGQPDPTRDPSADGKVGPQDPSQIAGDAKARDRKDATLDDIAKLRDQLGDKALQELAKQGLEKIGDEAADPKVRQEAEKILSEMKGQQESGKLDPSAPKAPGANDTKIAGQKQSDQSIGKGSEPKAGKGNKGDEKGNASATGKGAPGKPSTANPSNSGKGDVGPDGPMPPNPVDEAAARRAGELQLENLKQQIDKLRDKLTPEVMKKLNWTEQEREDFLRRMMADALARQQQQKLNPDKLPPPGAIKSLLPATGPRNLQQDPANQGAVVNDNPLPPPEIRDAQRIFNNKK